jgi:GDP-mannose transporter
MSHKKNEDLEMSGGKEFGERESFHHRGSILAQLENNPAAAVLAYCFSSISMTVVNKYVVSGSSWNLNFLYLAIQVCAATLRYNIKTLKLTYSVVCYLHGCNPSPAADGVHP